MTRRAGRMRRAGSVGRLAGLARAQRRALLNRAALVVGVVALTACELEEVTIPLGQEVVVVQGVMTLDPAAKAQYLVVERSLTGTMEIPDQDSLRGPPRPPLPISNAQVVVTREDGESVGFTEIPDTLGVYRYAVASPAFFLAGREYRLRVVTPRGDTVRGRTRMPAAPAVSGLPADGATFNRDHDTLRIRWSGGAGTKGVFVQVRPRDLARRLTLVFFTDSAEFRVPGNLPLPFFGDTLPPAVWVAGTRQTFTVAAMDTSFFDFLRTGNDPFTGSGFINSLEGGLGVFGAMAPVNRTYEVRGDLDHPFEGRYQLRAEFDGDSLVADLELYVNRDRPAPVLINALGIVTRSPTRGRFRASSRVEAGGRVADGALHLWLIDEVEGPNVESRVLLMGGFSQAGSASGTVRDRQGVEIGSYLLRRGE